jgi:hypothetical protein
MMLRRSLLAAAGLAPFAGPASAQAFPDRPLRLVEPFAAGGLCPEPGVDRPTLPRGPGAGVSTHAA